MTKQERAEKALAHYKDIKGRLLEETIRSTADALPL